jgi:hypothetical protein
MVIVILKKLQNYYLFHSFKIRKKQPDLFNELFGNNDEMNLENLRINKNEYNLNLE